MMTQHQDPLALAIPVAAEMAGISRSLLYELIADGRLKSFKVGNRRLILRADLQAFLEGERDAQAAQA
jgi:excisionase family DNA binding protein